MATNLYILGPQGPQENLVSLINELISSNVLTKKPSPIAVVSTGWRHDEANKCRHDKANNGRHLVRLRRMPSESLQALARVQDTVLVSRGYRRTMCQRVRHR